MQNQIIAVVLIFLITRFPTLTQTLLLLLLSSSHALLFRSDEPSLLLHKCCKNSFQNILSKNPTLYLNAMC